MVPDEAGYEVELRPRSCASEMTYSAEGSASALSMLGRFPGSPWSDSPDVPTQQLSNCLAAPRHNNKRCQATPARETTSWPGAPLLLCLRSTCGVGPFPVFYARPGNATALGHLQTGARRASQRKQTTSHGPCPVAYRSTWALRPSWRLRGPRK
jgi:hypothetical protein